MLKYFIIFILEFCLVLSISKPENLTGQAEYIYSLSKQAVCQILVVDKTSKEKVVIGSGFIFSNDAYLASNYHVVSAYVLHPDRYLLECLKADGTKQSITLLDIDVIHDLAILKMKPDSSIKNLNFSNIELNKGKRIYSMGNPKDLGMTIVEGNYNGLISYSMYNKILFSGSLNPGMSGGPAFDGNGDVLGINVATSGEQISFLVPIEYLRQLYNDVRSRKGEPVKNWNARINQQLLSHQQNYFDELISKNWDTVVVGKVIVPGRISKIFNCWVESEDKDDTLVKEVNYMGISEEAIYLDEKLRIGTVFYLYNWLEAKNISSSHFYNLFSELFKPKNSNYSASKEDVENFKTYQRFIELNGKKWEILMNTRKYKKYKDLYQVYVEVASLSEKKRGIVITFGLLGFTKENALKLIDKFIGYIKWQE